MNKISTHLWFDTQAKEAAAYYTSVFKNSRTKRSFAIHDTPSGSVDIVTIDLEGHEFTLISAGPLFKFNPSISFLVTCDTAAEVDRLWQELSKNGKTHMEIGEYPFSKRYGWTEDRYGLSWQIMLADRPGAQKITPVLMFTENVAGKAEEAINFYTSVFRNSAVDDIFRYSKGQEPDKEGTVMFGMFTLEGQKFAAMDSARTHGFKFNEAISLLINCDTQQEIDYYWSRLSADPRAEQCGWLKDKYGLSWQVAPRILDEMLATENKDKLARVTQAFLQMKKFDMAKLQEAYDGASRVTASSEA